MNNANFDNPSLDGFIRRAFEMKRELKAECEKRGIKVPDAPEVALKDVFKVESINDLPIVFNIAWYEQKAVIVLLALLYLGVQNIHSGPTLPAFFTPDIMKVLQEKFGIGTISTVENDIATLINNK